jgi:hypothetical protein
VVFGAVPVQWDATENNLFAAVSNVRHNICRIVNRCGSILIPRFELPDEHRELRGHGRGEGVVLILEALPNC